MQFLKNIEFFATIMSETLIGFMKKGLPITCNSGPKPSSVLKFLPGLLLIYGETLLQPRSQGLFLSRSLGREEETPWERG